MLSTSRTIYDKRQNMAAASHPEFGAIFLCGNATEKECLRRELFCLPSSFAHFVRQVKSGMILFLFKTGSRELHGVFKARSDGTVKRFPTAFGSSAKLFPAQVEVIRIWDCNPLHEDEFREAIRDNYFSKYKFRLGLSKVQVHKLLSLFNLRKLHVKLDQGTFATAGDISSIEYDANDYRSSVSQIWPQIMHPFTIETQFADHALHTRGKITADARSNGRAADIYGRLVTNYSTGSESEVSNPNEKYLNLSCYNTGRGIDKRVNSYERVENNSYTDANAGMSSGNKFLEHALHDTRSVSDRVRYETDDKASKYNQGEPFAPIGLVGHSALRTRRNVLADNGLLDVEEGTLLSGRYLLSSDIRSSADNEHSLLPCYRDATITNTFPHEPDGDKNTTSTVAYKPVGNETRNFTCAYESDGISASRELPYLRIRGIPEALQERGSLDDNYIESSLSPNSVRRCHASMKREDIYKPSNVLRSHATAPLVWSNRRDCSSGHVSLCSSFDSDSELCGTSSNFSNYDSWGYEGGLSEQWLRDMPSSSRAGGCYRRYEVQCLNTSPESYSFHNMVSQDKYGHPMAVNIYNDAGFVAASDLPNMWYGAENNVFSVKPRKENRNSVFNRLSAATEVPVGQATNPNDIIRVDETVCRCHKMMKRTRKIRPAIDQHKHIERTLTQELTLSKFESLEGVPETEKEEDDASAGKAAGSQLGGWTPFVNFKRRSDELRSSHQSDNMTSSGAQVKRRKLMRPKFGENELHKTGGSNEKNTVDGILVLSQEKCGHKNEAFGSTEPWLVEAKESNAMIENPCKPQRVSLNEKDTDDIHNGKKIGALNRELSGGVLQNTSGDESKTRALECQTGLPEFEGDGAAIYHEGSVKVRGPHESCSMAVGTDKLSDIEKGKRSLEEGQTV